MPGGSFLDQLPERARAVLDEPVHRYFAQGSRAGVSAAEAREAWDGIRLLPQVLRDVTDVATGTTLLGTSVAQPVAVAPTTMQRAAHPDGEVAMAGGVADAGSLLVVSTNAGSRFADIAATGVAWWLQCYVTADRARSAPVLERAVEAGARAVVLTADTPVVATKYDEGRTIWDVADPSWLRVNGSPDPDEGPGAEKARDLGPQDIAWLGATTGLPVVVKGVLRADDARRCLEAGAAAVWVSNHGGRQLDQTAPTAHCLAAVAEAVSEAGATGAEVYVDGGLRTGLHVLLALALGARAAFLGRTPLWALAVGGRDEVAAMFAALREELVEALRLTGCSSVSAVSRSLIA